MTHLTTTKYGIFALSRLDVETGNRIYHCRNRQKLVEGIAAAFSDYEKLCRAPAMTLQEEQRWMPMALSLIKKVLILQDQRRRKDLWKRKVSSEPYQDLLSFLGNPNSSVKRIIQSKETLRTIEDVETAERWFMKLMPDEYVRVAELDEIQRIASSNLLEAMHKAFSIFGPPSSAFPEAAVYETLAALLESLRVESGAATGDIAERLRRRHERARKHHQR